MIVTREFTLMSYYEALSHMEHEEEPARLASEEFFRKSGDMHFRMHYFDVDGSVSLEDLYQNFKARLVSEFKASLESEPA